MNNLVFNTGAENLKTAIYGQYSNDFCPDATDDEGNFIFSPEARLP
jgi:hypothetical protein